jgi:endoglucanase
LERNLDWSLLGKLSEAPGIGGQEEVVRAIVTDYLSGLGIDVRVDALGNVIATKGTSGPRIALSAHMDEIGFLVSHIDGQGFLRVQPVGFWEPKTLNAQRVIVSGYAGSNIVGTIQAGKGIPPYGDGPKPEQPQITDFYIDLGMDHEAVAALVEVGDMVTMDRSFTHTEKTVSGKALDDRAGLFVMLEALKAVDASNVTVVAVASVQEEVGLRGAITAAYGIEADIGIGIDVTQAIDLPGASPHEAVTRLHDGVALKIFDKSMIANRALNRHLRDVAATHQIPLQLEVLPVGGQDGAAFQMSRAGIPATTISIPTRYLHSPNERASKIDIAAAVNLLVQALPELGTRSYLA